MATLPAKPTLRPIGGSSSSYSRFYEYSSYIRLRSDPNLISHDLYVSAESCLNRHRKAVMRRQALSSAPKSNPQDSESPDADLNPASPKKSVYSANCGTAGLARFQRAPPIQETLFTQIKVFKICSIVEILGMRNV